MVSDSDLLEAMSGAAAIVNDRGNVVSSNSAWLRGQSLLAAQVAKVGNLRSAIAIACPDEDAAARWWVRMEQVRSGYADEALLPVSDALGHAEDVIATRLGVDGEVLLHARPAQRSKAAEALQEQVAALDATKRRLELALEGSRDGFWDLDLTTQQVFCSPRVAEIFGRSGEMPHRLEWYSEQVHPEERADLRDRWKGALIGYSSYYYAEHRLLTAEGHWLWVATRGKVVERDEDGRATRFVGILSDISERRQLEEQLAQSQKMDSIGRLAGGIAHDFNNLITGVLGYAELLRARLNDDPRGVYVDEIVKAANRAGNLTAQLLEFARRRVVEPRILDLNHCIADLEPMLRRLIGEDIQLDVQLGAALENVKLDPAQFEQILVNLAVNARDAMADGGRLTVATSNVQLDREYVRQNPDATEGSHVVLVVTDTGHGMDDDTKWRIFEPFFTTKPRGKGTGLGLSTCYGIVVQAGGHLRVFSEPGSGASFRIYIPSVSERIATPARPVAATDPDNRGSETILLAEDEDVVRQVVEETLVERGYRVLSARDGREAVAISQATPHPIDLLLSDVVMPHLNGRQVAEQVRAQRPEIRVLLMSGYVDDVVAPDQASGDFVLPKPFSTATLLVHVRRLLDGHNTPIESA
jgi:PAS domain S-box-containing protein